MIFLVRCFESILQSIFLGNGIYRQVIGKIIDILPVKVGLFQKVKAKFSKLSNRHACEPKIVPELLFPVTVVNTIYRKVASSSTSRLVARPRIFWLLMKGKFDPYVLWPLAWDLLPLNSRPVYCSRLYGKWRNFPLLHKRSKQ